MVAESALLAPTLAFQPPFAFFTQCCEEHVIRAECQNMLGKGQKPQKISIEGVPPGASTDDIFSKSWRKFLN